jgi:hypothetical protein
LDPKGRVQAHAPLGRPNLAHSYQGMVIPLRQLRQIIVGAHYRVPKVNCVKLCAHADEPGDSVLALLFDDIDAGSGVATSADQDQARTAHPLIRFAFAQP